MLVLVHIPSFLEDRLSLLAIRPTHGHEPGEGFPQPRAARSRRTRFWPHLGQHADHEPQQLFQGVETRHLTCHQMLDAALIGRRCTRGLGTKLHHKGPIGRERRLGLGHN
jgi:hypothetical protein